MKSTKNIVLTSSGSTRVSPFMYCTPGKISWHCCSRPQQQPHQATSGSNLSCQNPDSAYKPADREPSVEEYCLLESHAAGNLSCCKPHHQIQLLICTSHGWHTKNRNIRPSRTTVSSRILKESLCAYVGCAAVLQYSLQSDPWEAIFAQGYTTKFTACEEY